MVFHIRYSLGCTEKHKVFTDIKSFKKNPTDIEKPLSYTCVFCCQKIFTEIENKSGNRIMNTENI